MNELILVVEDSQTQALILESDLQNHNFQVAIVTNGQDAIKWLSENRPSLVISDIMMPGMNGFELCRHIKTQNITNDIPVILLTYLTSPDEVIEGLVAGADSFITKPYDKNYLISHIEKLLADQSGIATEKKSFGVEIIFEGKKRIIQAEQQQIIKLLLNIYDGAIQQNTQLIQIQDQLKLLNENLEAMVEDRTSDLLTEIETRKFIENELKESENRVELAVQSANIGMWDFDLVNDTSWRSLRHDEIFGYNDLQPEWNQQILLAHVLPEDRENVNEMFEKAFNTDFLQFECRITGADGILRWISVQGRIQRNQSAIPLRILGTIIDITDRKNAEQKVIENEHLLKTITSEVQEVIFAYDAKGVFTFSDGKGLRKLGLKPGQLVGMSVFDFYKDYPDIIFTMTEALNGLPRKTEGIKIGHLKFNTTFQPIIDADGKVSSVVGLAVDVTEYNIPLNSDNWLG